MTFGTLTFPIPIIILLMVLLGIALRNTINIPLRIWHIMGLGALATLLTGQIAPIAAAKAINLEIISYLFGVFVLGKALEHSGFLQVISYRLFRHSKSGHVLLLTILIVAALGSALFMNDTIAIIGVPVILMLCQEQKQLIKPLLFGLAFAITFGSLLTPIGNPQTLLIAVASKMQDPFVVFFKEFILPTLICLGLSYGIVAAFFHGALTTTLTDDGAPPQGDLKLTRLCQLAVIIMILLIFAKIIVSLTVNKYNIPFSAIALLAAAPIVLFSKERFQIIKGIDWGTLIFFVSMFVLMASVWHSGFFQVLINKSQLNLTAIPTIMVVSIVLSQFISNVPLVVLYLPLLLHGGATTSQLMALAAGATISGNLMLIGAASNVIIVHGAESRGREAFSFMEFFKLGLPLTALSVLVYWFIN